MGAKQILMRHTSKVTDEIGLQKTEEKEKPFLIGKIIAKIENKNPYKKKTEKGPKIILYSLYSTTNITRGTIIMVMGDYKVAYLIKNKSAYGDFIIFGRWYTENATKHFLKHFLFERAVFE